MYVTSKLIFPKKITKLHCERTLSQAVCIYKTTDGHSDTHHLMQAKFIPHKILFKKSELMRI